MNPLMKPNNELAPIYRSVSKSVHDTQSAVVSTHSVLTTQESSVSVYITALLQAV
jgi:hypothetical protein